MDGLASPAGLPAGGCTGTCISIHQPWSSNQQYAVHRRHFIDLSIPATALGSCTSHGQCSSSSSRRLLPVPVYCHVRPAHLLDTAGFNYLKENICVLSLSFCSSLLRFLLMQVLFDRRCNSSPRCHSRLPACCSPALIANLD